MIVPPPHANRRALLGAALSGLSIAALGCGSDKASPDRAGSNASGAPREGLAMAIRELLAGSSTLQILALNPRGAGATASPAGAASGGPVASAAAGATPALHGYGILGAATLADAATRERLVTLIDRGVRESDGTIAACFNPRHGLSAKQRERVVDLVICFECRQIRIWDGDTRSDVLTSRDVEGAVSTIFREAGLTIAP